MKSRIPLGLIQRNQLIWDTPLIAIEPQVTKMILTVYVSSMGSDWPVYLHSLIR